MLKGTYIGGREELRGKTAIVRFSNECVLAQFDDTTLDEGKAALEDCLAHGWTEFPLSDWRVEVDTERFYGLVREGNGWETARWLGGALRQLLRAVQDVLNHCDCGTAEGIQHEIATAEETVRGLTRGDGDAPVELIHRETHEFICRSCFLRSEPRYKPAGF